MKGVGREGGRKEGREKREERTDERREEGQRKEGGFFQLYAIKGRNGEGGL